MTLLDLFMVAVGLLIVAEIVIWGLRLGRML